MTSPVVTILIVERSFTLEADSFEEIYRFEFDNESSTPTSGILEDLTLDRFTSNDSSTEEKAFYRVGAISSGE